MDEVSSSGPLDCPRSRASPIKRLFHLVFESHTGRAVVPIPKRSASPRVISTPQWWIGLKALDQNRPIREGTIHFGKGSLALYDREGKMGLETERHMPDRMLTW